MTEFIAEISSNHNQDLSRCLELIDTAASIGCDGVKFQLFKVDQLFAPSVLDRKDQRGNTLRDREAWELPVEFLPNLYARCRANGLKLLCSPFYLDAVEELYSFVDIYKIASYELPWRDLLLACAGTGRPVVLSTGMATMTEIVDAVRSLRAGGVVDLTVLHCVSSYPCPRNACNLSAIGTLRSFLDCKVGWSDHTVDAGVIYRAVHRWGAEMIEFHLDIDGQGADFEYGHCWLPGQIAPVIADIKASQEMDGEWLKRPAECEMADRDWRRDPIDGYRPMRGVRRES
jgi:N-acetylneuraminate synthase